MKNTLAATPVTEKAILADLFPYYQRGAGGRGAKSSSIVRVFKQKLLERLDEYYEGDGAGDLVLISLLSKPRRKGYKPPPGEAYRPAFAYNPEHPVQQNYRLGLYHLDQCTPADDGIALDYLEAALSRKRDHAPALLAKAEIFVRRALYYHLRLTPTQSLEVAQRAVRQSLAANDTSWRAHAMQGILHCVHSRMNEAQVSFARAIALDAAATRYGAWYYAGFLMAMGRSDEALGIAEERARLCLDDLFAQASKGIFLYLARRFDESLITLTLAEAMNAKHWLLRVASALLALARNEPAAAQVFLRITFSPRIFFRDSLPFASPRRCACARREKVGERPAVMRPIPLFSAVYAALDDLVDKLPSPPEQLAQIKALSEQRYVALLQDWLPRLLSE